MKRQDIINQMVEERSSRYRMTDDDKLAMRRQLDIALPQDAPVVSAPATVQLPADSPYAVAYQRRLGIDTPRTPGQLTALRINGEWVSESPEMARRAAEAEQWSIDRQQAFDQAHPPVQRGAVSIRSIAPPS